MTSKDRKHKSKENSAKNRSFGYGDNESSLDKNHRKSSSKSGAERRESSNRKQVAIDRDELEQKYKINNYRDVGSDKQDKEERRIRRANDELSNEKKRERENEPDKKRRHKTEKSDESNEGKRHHKRGSETENSDKRKSKTENKDEYVRTRHRNERKEEGGNLKENEEISKDGEKRRHQNKGEVGEDVHRKKRDKEKESLGDVLVDRMDEPIQSKLRSNGDQEYEGKHRSHRDIKEGNRKEYKDETVTQKNESRLSNKQNQIKVEEVDYDDDFENYDEEEFEEEVVELSPTLIEPANTDQSSSISHSSKGSEKLSSSASQASKPLNEIGKIHSSFINFKIAQKKYSHDLVANRMLSRAYDLSRLIEMDRVEYDILEMAPVMEHSQYMRLFGKEGCQHEGCQTGSDNIARESQTEIIDERVVWTQCPPLDDNDCIQIVSDSRGFHGQTTLMHRDEIASTGPSESESMIQANIGLTSLSQTLSMIENVLEEEASCEVTITVPVSHENGKHAISSGYSKYSSLDGLDCLIARFAVANSNVFVTIHQSSKSKTTSEDKQFKIVSPIAVWKVSGNSSEPYLYLSYPSIDETQSHISFVTFSPDPGASHVICGLSSGAIVLWDLREYSYVKCRQRSLSPAYLTSVSSEDGDSYHKGPIVGLQPVNTGISSNSYQLISLDSFAQLFIWMVSLVNQHSQWNLASGSLTDLNLRPGARYRMSRVTSMYLISSIYGAPSSYVITSMTVDPSCNTHLFCGTNSGQIIQHVRANQKIIQNCSSVHPKTLGGVDLFEFGTVTQLDFYPFFEPYLLAGYDDGLIRIFAVGKSKYLLSFHYKHHVGILQLKWSRSHPAIFFSLDVDGNLCVWNVLTSLYNPIHVQTLPGYIGFDLSSDSKWQIKDKTSTNNKARLLLWAFDGRIEVHELSDMISNPDLDDSFKTCSLFQSLI